MLKKFAVVAVMAVALAGCETARQDRVAGGALIGAGGGALIGGLATNSVGGAVAGGLIGAAAGGIIADATRPGRCYYRDSYGRRRYTRC